MFVIEIPQNYTSYAFFNQTLKSLHDYFVENKKTVIMIDFTLTEYIDPIVLVYLMSVGRILRSIFPRPTKLKIPYKPKLLGFLNTSDFIRLGISYDFFEVDDYVLGGYDDSYKKEFITKICYYDCSKTNSVSYDLMKSNRAIEQFYNIQNINKFITNDLQEKKHRFREDRIRILAELIENVKLYADGHAFYTIQYYKANQNLQICISDCGDGYYKKIVDNINKNEFKLKIFSSTEFFSNENKNIRNLMGILEAVFHRYDDPIYGIYSIAEQTISNNGVIRIHSLNTQLVLTRNTVLTKEYAYKIAMDIDVQKKEILRNRLRFYNYSFKGAHIEVDINYGDGEK